MALAVYELAEAPSVVAAGSAGLPAGHVLRVGATGERVLVGPVCVHHVDEARADGTISVWFDKPSVTCG